MRLPAIDKRLRENFTWVLSGNALYSACQWSFLIAIAKLGSARAVGEYALGMAVSSPIILFANLQLRALIASDVNGDFRFGEYLGFRITTLGVALLAITGTAINAAREWRVAGVVILVGVGLALEYLSDAYYGFMQRHDRMDRVSTSLIIKGPVSVIAIGGTMYFTRSVVWTMIALILARLAVLLAWDSRLGFAGIPRRELRIRMHRGKYWRLLRLAFPLGVVAMLGSLNSNIPRYFLESHLGTSELGIYSAIASLLTAGTMVVSAYGQSSFLPVAEACAHGDRSRFRQYVIVATLLGAGLGGGAVIISGLFGKEILARLFRPEYGQYSYLLVHLMAAGTISFIASGLGYLMTAARSLRPQIPLLGATTVTSAIVSAWSVPRSGLQGAVNSLIASALVLLIGEAIILWAIDHHIGRNFKPCNVTPIENEQGMEAAT